MNKDDLKKLQSVETLVLKRIHEFCIENKINYTLAYGTLLGACRHGGPIPWDDDVDIAMTRNEYNTFLNNWKKNSIIGYYLDEMGPETDSHINHTKIRKDGTILSSKEEYDQNKHNGIWVDVFVIDKIPTDVKLRKKMLFWAKIRLIYTRDHPMFKGRKIEFFISKMMISLPKKIKKKILIYADNYVQQYKDLKKDYELVNLAAPSLLYQYYESNMMDEYKIIEYDSLKLMSIKYPEKMLVTRYGDWKKLPPKEEQVCGHNPEILDFGE